MPYLTGGNPLGCPYDAPSGPGEDCGAPHGGGYSYGPLAETVHFEEVVTTEWVVGQPATVGWGLTANHGGGYSYRLCRLGSGGRAGLTEECFRQGHLEFASDWSWVQWGEDKGSRVTFKANRTTVGTQPRGSQWTKNPIPDCVGYVGGQRDLTGRCPQGTQVIDHT